MHSEHYKEEYTEEFASRWDDLIGWEGRLKGENGFFETLLEKQGCKRVADVATGTGFHAVTLSRKGFEMVASDGCANMIEQTKRNATRFGVELAGVEVADWRELDRHFGEAAFDGMLCLGNAFTHLFEHEARVEALGAMYRALRPGGVLVLDHRNYDRILDQGYSSKHQHYYTGEGVEVQPVEINDKVVRFEYSYPDNRKYHLNLFPLRRDYVTELLQGAGFAEVRRYGDFAAPFDPAGVDFLQQVAIKAR